MCDCDKAVEKNKNKPNTPCDDDKKNCPLLDVEFHMHVDADRNGTVDDDRSGFAKWKWGKANKGAVILCNNDDDDGTSKKDNDDDKVNGANDGKELAPLEIRKEGSKTPPPSMKASLSVSDKKRIRIFDKASAGGTEIIGPDKGASYTFPDLNFSLKKLGMEAVTYAEKGFDGKITITFKVKGGGKNYSEKAQVRVAPWMMPNHLDEAEKVFVVNSGSFNDRFRTDLDALVKAAKCSLKQHPGNDIWMQDCMEFGYSNLPGRGFRAVTRASRDRPLKTFPESLLTKDLGYHEPGTMAGSNTFDSDGNLEVTPPVKNKAGKNFPWGRIYYGPGRSGEKFNADVKEFLKKQEVQEPFEIDTAWLAVGHVDEIVSFVPAKDGKGFRMLIASPVLAYKFLEDNKASHGGDKLLTGREFPEFDSSGSWVRDRPAEVTIKNFLDSGIPGMSLTASTLRTFNKTTVKNKLDGVKKKFETEAGLDLAKDVIEVPILYMPNEDFPSFADALTAGTVNMLVVNKNCIVPKPFGPVVGGKDLFEEDLKSKLKPLGLKVKFIDDWHEYHVNQGEVHCGTNTLRKPTEAKWWEFEP